MTFNQYFNRVFCVNLDRRTDRWSMCLPEFEKACLTVERFSAVDGSRLPIVANQKINRAEVGCSLSHAAILKKMVAADWEKILILEDDVEFSPNAASHFSQWISQVPRDWDMLYLGGNHISNPTPVTPHVSRVVKTYTTSHYAITRKMARLAINKIEQLHSQVDVVYSQFQRTHKCYAFTPSLAWQKPGYSDIQGKIMNYKRMKPPTH
jgi:GR25 family glycosyltransferase involved in LPS biosynthesis